MCWGSLHRAHAISWASLIKLKAVRVYLKLVVPGLFPGFVCMIFPDSSSVLIVLSTLVVRGKLEIRNPQKETILDLNHRKTAPQNSQLVKYSVNSKYSTVHHMAVTVSYIIWIFHMAVTSYGYFIPWQQSINQSINHMAVGGSLNAGHPHGVVPQTSV